MNIYTLGNGFVGQHLPYPKISDRIYCIREQICGVLKKYKPDCLINAIGFCGSPNIDQCEIEKEKTIISNTVIPILLAIECEKLGIHLINIGSGCIYFGESPNSHYIKDGSALVMPTKIDSGWRENDYANPKSFYSHSKYSADLAIGGMKNVTTLRIRMPISDKDVPRNLINKLRGYKQIINIPNSMTFMSDLVRCVEWAAREHKTGIYHVVNPEPLTAVQIMEEYCRYHPGHTFDILHTEKQLDAITVAKRSNCILDSLKLHTDGFQMTPSKEALETCMKNYVNRRPNVE